MDAEKFSEYFDDAPVFYGKRFGLSFGNKSLKSL